MDPIIALSPRSPAEQEALGPSATAALFLSLFGVGFSVVAQSDAVLLHGVHALILGGSLVVTARVSERLGQPGSPHHRLGREAMAQTIGVAHGAAVTLLLLFAGAAALVQTFGGGQVLVPGVTLTYCLIAGVISVGLSVRQRQVAEDMRSGLLRADADAWFVHGAVALAFAFLLLLTRLLAWTDIGGDAPYLDPVVVLLMAGYLGASPAVSLWEGGGRMLPAKLRELPDNEESQDS